MHVLRLASSSGGLGEVRHIDVRQLWLYEVQDDPNEFIILCIPLLELTSALCACCSASEQLRPTAKHT